MRIITLTRSLIRMALVKDPADYKPALSITNYNLLFLLHLHHLLHSLHIAVPIEVYQVPITTYQDAIVTFPKSGTGSPTVSSIC